MRTIAVIQARMGSTRLPGKVLMDLHGAPMLEQVIRRTRRASSLDEVVVATSTGAADEPIVALCAARGWPCFRGSLADLLDRYYQAALSHRADAVVRVTSDCPLIDPGLIDRLVEAFAAGQPLVQYAANFWPRRTYPQGLDAEVVRLDALERAWKEDRNPEWREHATEYVLHHPEMFTMHGVLNDADLSHLRWTVDTPEDLRFVLHLFEYFGDDRFSWREALAVLARHPQWLEINRHVKQKVVA